MSFQEWFYQPGAYSPASFVPAFAAAPERQTTAAPRPIAPEGPGPGDVPESYHQSLEQYRVLLENTLEGIWVLDARNHTTFVNRAMAEMLGYRTEDMLGRHLLDFMDGASLDETERLTLAQTSGPKERHELRFRCRDGGELWALVSAKALPDQHGWPQVMLSVIGDVSHRRRMEEALQESERRFRRLFESNMLAIAFWHRDGRLTEANHAFCELIGCSPEEVRAGLVHWRELTPQEWHLRDQEAMEELHTSGVWLPYEKQFTRRDGSRVSVLIGGASLGGTQTQGVAFVVDLTARKLAEQALAQSQAALRAANDELRRINESLEARVAERTADLEERTQQLQRLAGELTQAEHRERWRVAQIIHDFQPLLLTVRSRLSTLSTPPAPAATPARALRDIIGLVNESIDAVSSLAAELCPPVVYDSGLAESFQWLAQWYQEKYQLAVQVAAEPSVVVPQEDIRVVLFQAVRELLFNVVKHAGVKAAAVRLAATPAGELRIAVADQGAGFDPAQIHACPGSTPNTFSLPGLQERIRSLGGQFEISSARGAGTQVTLRGPWAEATDAPAAAPPPLAPAAAKRKIRVLVADDHSILRQGLRRVLEREADIEVVGDALDGLEAVELTQKLKPDVVTMDIYMPRLNGIEATAQIMATVPHTRVLALSMNEDQHQAAEMRAAGAVAYLKKDSLGKDLLTAIRSAAELAA